MLPDPTILLKPLEEREAIQLSQIEGTFATARELLLFEKSDYDPQRRRFVGTFTASCMTHLWPCEGTPDASGKVLTLDSEGPGFDEQGALTKHQDIIEFVTHDHRTLSSPILSQDSQWKPFMKAHDRRQKQVVSVTRKPAEE